LAIDILYIFVYNVYNDNKQGENEMTDLMKWHEPENTEKINDIARSMMDNGWIGTPVVVWGEQAYTGAHRIAAAEIAEVEVPTICLTELFDEAGLDMDEALWMYGHPTADDVQMAMVIGQLPANIIDKYGIDII
jgi:hypothetical protein